MTELPAELANQIERAASIESVLEELKSLTDGLNRVRPFFSPEKTLAVVQRLMWLLGLSDAERSFVEDIATAATKGRPTDAYESLMVFADWLEDNFRTKEGEAIRKLAPETGDVVLANYRYQNGEKERALEVLREIRNKLLKYGRFVSVVALPNEFSVECLDRKTMESLGWVPRTELEECRLGIDRAVRDIVHLRYEQRVLLDEIANLKERLAQAEGESARAAELNSSDAYTNDAAIRERNRRIAFANPAVSSISQS